MGYSYGLLVLRSRGGVEVAGGLEQYLMVTSLYINVDILTSDLQLYNVPAALTVIPLLYWRLS